MRDLLSKLDSLVSETALQNKEDLKAKQQALDDLEADPTASSDPEISAAIDQRRSDLEREAKSKGFVEAFEIGDEFGISFSEDHEISTTIVDILEDGIVIELDDLAMEMLTNEGLTFLEGEVVNEEKQKGLDGKACWKGYKRMGTKMKGGKRVDNCVKVGEDIEESGLQYYTGKKKYGKDGMTALAQAGRDGASEEELGKIKDKYKKEDADVDEAKYQGREVQLGKKMPGDVKKSKVYVKNAKGNVVKVNFGDKKMRIKKSNPARRKSFRARHNCKNPGPRWKARYWSCRSW
jgi:hypothetical protein